jgi:choline-glycine betaine transporter
MMQVTAPSPAGKLVYIRRLLSRSRSPRISSFHLAVVGCAVVAIIGIVTPESLERAADVVTTTVFRAVDWFYMAPATARGSKTP